jgi:hypothetical protein
MFGQQVRELELRKKALLLESEHNRLRLLSEVEQLRCTPILPGLLEGVRSKLGPWALPVSALAGMVFAMRGRRSSFGEGFLGSALAVVPPLVKLWRTFTSRRRRQSESEFQSE